MASLTGSSVASSYKDLLQVSNSNSGIDGTARVVSDGEDTASKLFLDTNRVGVGIAPTEGTLHVHTATAGSITADGAADDLVVENSGAGGITILTPNNALGQLAFGSPADAYGAFIGWKSDDNQMTIATANAGDSIVLQTANKVAALTINSSQVVELTSGQLKFPASQNASSDANTLDDYEEGTHTATVTCGTSGTITLNGSYQTLSYVKVGRQVTVNGLLFVSSVSSPDGFFKVSLPFAIASGDQHRVSGGVSMDNTVSANVSDFVGVGLPGESVLRVYLGDNILAQSDSADDIKAGTYITVGLTYFV